VPGASLRPALLVLCRCVAELLVVDASACEVRLLARRCRLDFAELLVGEVEHGGGVDDPDPGGEVLPALVHERVPAVAGAVEHVVRDAELQRPSLGAGGERVELGVEELGPVRTVPVPRLALAEPPSLSGGLPSTARDRSAARGP
jgi:hypothetical protein